MASMTTELEIQPDATIRELLTSDSKHNASQSQSKQSNLEFVLMHSAISAISAAEDIECGREPFRLNSKRISTFHRLGLADHAYFMPAVDFENMARLSG